MDKERLMNYFEHHYLPKRDVLNRIPLGASLEEFWQELVNRRRSKATMLPMRSPQGGPYWFVLTDTMIAASEKIVEEAMQPYRETETAILEEAFYTSFLEGSQMTVDDAIDFMRTSEAPRDIHEQMLQNNRQAISFIMDNVYQPVNESVICTLAGILTAEMAEGGETYRVTDTHVIPSMAAEPYMLPSAAMIPGMVQELCAYLADRSIHPLLKAAVAHAWFMAVRPFPEGNERLARMIASMILNQARYTFFNEVSLSALIAQDGYSYYDAIGNLLRDENGGDWTYLVEYYVALLGKAVDEIHLHRQKRIEDLARQSLDALPDGQDCRLPALPQELALSDSSPDGTEPPSKEEHASLELKSEIEVDPNDPFRENTAGAESTEEALKMAGFFPVGLTGDEEETEIAVNPMGFMELHNRLKKCMNKPYSLMTAYCRRLLDFMDQGKSSFVRADITDGIAKDRKQAGNIITRLRTIGFILPAGEEDGVKLYKMNVNYFYTPSVLNMIQRLIHSTTSGKDRRIGSMLLQKLDDGYIDMTDYRRAGYESRWQTDMKLAQQLGIVAKEHASRYRINLELLPDFNEMGKSQKTMATEIYQAFGQEIFTPQMIVATLEYSSSHTRAALHAFTLMGILECRKDDLFRYQFLVTPEERPECFFPAA